MITPVLLCGGSAIRLCLVSRKSPLRITPGRLRRVGKSVIAEAAVPDSFVMPDALRTDTPAHRARVVLVPLGGNTAAAMAKGSLMDECDGQTEEQLVASPTQSERARAGANHRAGHPLHRGRRS